jgi:hypothetical protein
MARQRKSVDISKEQYLAAIKLLEEGGTKKAACEVLGINYNTTRLADLIETFQKREEVAKNMRAKKRGTPVDDAEFVEMATAYFERTPLNEIARMAFRSEAVVKHHLEVGGAMLRQHGNVDPLNPPMLPDICMRDSFKIGEIVWVAGYNCVGEIKAEFQRGGENAYKVYLLDASQERVVYQMVYELGSLEHLTSRGFDVTKLRSFLDKDSRDELLASALKGAAMRARG